MSRDVDDSPTRILVDARFSRRTLSNPPLSTLRQGRTLLQTAPPQRRLPDGPPSTLPKTAVEDRWSGITLSVPGSDIWGSIPLGEVVSFLSPPSHAKPRT